MNASQKQADRLSTRQILKSRGITPTQQRVEIARVLLAQPQHLSAEELLALVNGRGHGVSKATVYNTLGLFARHGLVREVIVDPSKIFYDSNTSDHHHLYNTSTGVLTDIESHEIAVGGLPRTPEGTEVTGVDIIVRVQDCPSKTNAQG